MSETEFGPDAKRFQVIPEFYTEAVKLEFRSKQEGRPVFEDREFVRIIVPGNRGSVVHEPVNDEHKARWPEQYKAFKEGREQPIEGTPLTEWAVSDMTKARAAELAFFHIRTVEELAALADDKIQKLGMGMFELRKKAQTWLEIAAKGSAPIEKLLTENEHLTGEVSRLERMMTEMRARLEQLTQEKADARA